MAVATRARLVACRRCCCGTTRRRGRGPRRRRSGRVEWRRATAAKEDLDDLILEPDAKVLFVASACGIWTGAGVVALNKAIHLVEDSAMSASLPDEALLIPVAGGVTVGLVQLALQQATDGEGRGSKLVERVRPLVDSALAAITLGSGFSLGPEGPSVEIGKSLASSFKQAVPKRCFPALLAAGSAAGISAGFNAPISGVFFALETVLEKADASSSAGAGADPAMAPKNSALDLAVVTLASVLAAIVSQIGLGAEPAMSIPDYRLGSYLDFPLYLVLGYLSGAISFFFTETVDFAAQATRSVRVSTFSPILPIFGGIAMGVVASAVPEVTYEGFENFNRVLRGDSGIAALGIICVSKILATSISKASGLQGGLYAPTLFLGAATGSLYGKILDNALVGTQFQDLVAGPGAFALVGMAATLSAGCRVPLTSTLLLFELTRDYGILLPTLGGVALSFLFVSSRNASPSTAGVLVGAEDKVEDKGTESVVSSGHSTALSPSDSATHEFIVIPLFLVIRSDRCDAATLRHRLRDYTCEYFLRVDAQEGGRPATTTLVSTARAKAALERIKDQGKLPAGGESMGRLLSDCECELSGRGFRILSPETRLDGLYDGSGDVKASDLLSMAESDLCPRRSLYACIPSKGSDGGADP